MNPPTDYLSRHPALRLPEFRLLLGAGALATLASRFIAVVIGYQIYEMTGDPLSLGFLGLVEAIPAVSLALFGGYVADRNDRRKIVLLTQAVSIVCALLFALCSWKAQGLGVAPLFAVVFIAGIARGFNDPAYSAFDAQVIPAQYYVNASAWGSSVWQGCAIVGPALGGFSYHFIGAVNTYLLVALLFSLSWFCILGIAPKSIPIPEEGESIYESITLGVRYVFKNQVLVGSMALDLFAVLFGGAVALLPVFAKDILHVGPIGFGLMNAAPSIGALAVMLYSTHRPPVRNAGRNMILSVAGFGVSIILFALSTNFYLSLFALALTGMFDGISMVVRKTVMRMMSPENMRGRIAAVNWVFIGSSNEIGAFESGFAAKLLGTTRSVWIGGVVSLVVVGVTALIAPKLRNLKIDLEAGKVEGLDEAAEGARSFE